MECLLLLVTLLLIIKESEVSGQKTGYMNQAMFQPDLFSCLGAINQPIYVPNGIGTSSSYSSSLPQIIIDNTRDDDDDWLSLLYFLILALKDRKSGCSYKNERPRQPSITDYRSNDYYDDRYFPDYYYEKPDCKTNRRKDFYDDSYRPGFDLGPFSNNNGPNCGCIFIPYPIAVPLNFANGQFYSDVEICGCGDECCNKLLYNGKETNEICITIKAD